MTSTDRIVQVTTAVAAIIGALTGLWNAYQYAALAGAGLH